MIKICGSAPIINQDEGLKLPGRAIDEGCRLIEFRLDYAETKLDLKILASKISLPKIATLRPIWEGGLYRGPEDLRTATLLEAVEAGFDYVDLEVKTSEAADIAEKIREKGGRVIASYHDFKTTPNITELRNIIKSEEDIGDICKMVTTANTHKDNLTILNLQADMKTGSAICFAMGNLGLPSRIMSPLLGAPFAYASISEGLQVAPGQVTVKGLTHIYELLGVDL